MVCLVGLVGLSTSRFARRCCLTCGLSPSPLPLLCPLDFEFDRHSRVVGRRSGLHARCRHSGKAILTKVTDGVVEIGLVGGNLYLEAGQFVRIAVPSIGSMQFQPCTISSAP